jgi:hypothetical protein
MKRRRSGRLFSPYVPNSKWQRATAQPICSGPRVYPDSIKPISIDAYRATRSSRRRATEQPVSLMLCDYAPVEKYPTDSHSPNAVCTQSDRVKAQKGAIFPELRFFKVRGHNSEDRANYERACVRWRARCHLQRIVLKRELGCAAPTPLAMREGEATLLRMTGLGSPP